MARLEAHAREWCDLPLMPAKSIVPAADGDIALLEQLDDEVFAALSFLPERELRKFRARGGVAAASLEFALRKELGDWRQLEWPPIDIDGLLASWPSPIWEEGQAA